MIHIPCAAQQNWAVGEADSTFAAISDGLSLCNYTLERSSLTLLEPGCNKERAEKTNKIAKSEIQQYDISKK